MWNLFRLACFILGQIIYYLGRFWFWLSSFIWDEEYYRSRVLRFNPFGIVGWNLESTNYNDYTDAIQRVHQDGPKPDYYLTTSGTTGVKKVIPFFDKFPFPWTILLPFLRPDVWSHLVFGQTMLLLKKGKIYDNDGVYQSNGITRQMQRITHSNGLLVKLMREISNSPFPLYRYGDDLDIDFEYPVLDLHLIHGLLNPNLRVIFGYFNRSVVEQMDRLRENAGMFSMALHEGKYSPPGNKDERLIYYFPPNPDRARQISRILNDRDATGFMKRLWPNLKLIICGTSGSFKIYRPRLIHYSRNTPVFSPYYACTEMVIGLNLGLRDQEIFTLDHRFGCINQVPVDPNGKISRLLINNNHGLHLYQTGDLIERTDQQISYHGRDNESLILPGLVVAADEIAEILTKVFELQIRDYFFEIMTEGDDHVPTKPRIRFYIVLAQKTSILRQVLNQTLLAETIDQKFRVVNSGYRKARENHQLDRLELRFLYHDTAQEIVNYLVRMKGIHREQIKIPRQLDRDTDMLMRNIIERNIIRR